LIFASVSALERRDLGRELLERSVRRLVDLRLGPVYRPFRLEREAFFELLFSLRVVYVHMHALADRYIGESWHAERYRQLLEAHYAMQREALGELRAMIDDGPVMAIVPSYSDLGAYFLVRPRGSPAGLRVSARGGLTPSHAQALTGLGSRKGV
jgi:hypothetical protein